MNIPKMRSDEKLHNGDYLYIQVGHRFYAGDQAEFQDVPVSSLEKKELSRRKGEQWRDWAYRMWDYRKGYDNTSRGRRDARKGSQATYMKPVKEEKRSRRQATGRLIPLLVDQPDQAKRYRRTAQAQSACERIRTCYAGLDVKVDIRMMKGDAK